MRRILFLMLCVAAIGFAGCNSGGPDPKVEGKRVDAAKRMREIYDKAKGNYESMDPGDRAEYIGMFQGNEENAKRMWNYIKQGGEGGAGTRPPGAG